MISMGVRFSDKEAAILSRANSQLPASVRADVTIPRAAKANPRF